MTDPARALAHEQGVVDRLYARLDEVRDRTEADLRRSRVGQTAGTPGALTEQEAFIRLYAERLAALVAAEQRLCFGRLDLAEGPPRYIGRIGLADDDQSPLLTDWRAPAAEAFYQATSADPRGVVRRRHLVTQGRTITGIEDDVLDLEALADERGGIGADDVQGGGVLMAALAARRTGRMHDIVATLQAEQDAIVRAPLPGILVVEGGPGCGKTVVALHRAAYLLYTHRDRLAKSGILVVGPNPVFLRYIELVLPALGETAAVLATPGTLFPGVEATGEEPPAVAAIKGRAGMADVIHRAVRDRQRVPAKPVRLRVGSAVITMTPDMVRRAIDRARSSRRPHNVARRTFVMNLLDTLAVQLAEATHVDAETHREALLEDLRDAPDVRREVNLCWMPLTAQRLVADLWADPVRLAAAAPSLSGADRALLARGHGSPWTPADVPLLDEAAESLGIDDEAERRERSRASAERRAEAEYAQGVLEMTGVQGVSADQIIERYAAEHVIGTVAERAGADREWIYGHVVVDEAQEVSPMMWRLLARRCPALSMTIVGDLDQTSSAGGASDWAEALGRIAKARHAGEQRWRVERLTVNYRTPRPFMDLARRVLEAAGRVTVPVESIREGESPVHVALPPGPEARDALADLVAAEIADPDLGRLAVVCARAHRNVVEATLAERLGTDAVGTGTTRLDAPVSVLDVATAKGLEFDVVVVLEPAAIEAESAQPGRDLYVALTRPTRRLVVAHAQPLPPGF